ncbi:hypothetical protein [Arthrobacter woluwensis]|uniref:Uncharacterized protein n=1 Tax=Arthrobacter woluwensis TaxID=156980 RepID=A0A1H4I9L3_9MICC|nr:hypothetical protein [Arthrobacter woluwensis]SEB30048.1 hypothetical protein SAMN04489745_0104 [Arthrobacter woluwensis]
MTTNPAHQTSLAQEWAEQELHQDPAQLPDSLTIAALEWEKDPTAWTRPLEAPAQYLTLPEWFEENLNVGELCVPDWVFSRGTNLNPEFLVLVKALWAQLVITKDPQAPSTAVVEDLAALSREDRIGQLEKMDTIFARAWEHLAQQGVVVDPARTSWPTLAQQSELRAP